MGGLAPQSDGRCAPLHASIRAYYAAKIAAYGPSPFGVDWENRAAQAARFAALLELCRGGPEAFSINDLGCGYGALLEVLLRRHGRSAVDYRGVDLSAEMIATARRLWPGHADRFACSAAPGRVADYGVASGIFNVQLGNRDASWEGFIRGCLEGLHATSRLGFAVNFLDARAPRRRAAVKLYRATPDPWIAFCERAFGAEVALKEDYGLPDFTLLVRRRGSV